MEIFGGRNQDINEGGGLDSFIEGRNDPDHPFNREELVELWDEDYKICKPCYNQHKDCRCLEGE